MTLAFGHPSGRYAGVSGAPAGGSVFALRARKGKGRTDPRSLACSAGSSDRSLDPLAGLDHSLARGRRQATGGGDETQRLRICCPHTDARHGHRHRCADPASRGRDDGIGMGVVGKRKGLRDGRIEPPNFFCGYFRTSLLATLAFCDGFSWSTLLATFAS